MKVTEVKQNVKPGFERVRNDCMEQKDVPLLCAELYFSPSDEYGFYAGE